MPISERAAVLGEAIAAELRVAVGAEHVCDTPTELDRYSRCTIPWQRRCAAVVFPGSAQEVAQVVKVAAKNRVALWTFSTGRNWGYGTTLAAADGALVMILERMNRILEVNEELAYAVIEPGVTYEKLNAHLKEHRHKLWVDCIDGTPRGSVIGNALDRGVGGTPYGDHFGSLCGLEVVLPDGDLVRVGGALCGLKTWHTHKWGVGPYLEGLFSQSNFGIVTQAGVWLMPQPEDYNSYVFEIQDERNLSHVIDAFRQLALHGVVQTKLHMINDFVSLTVLTQRVQEDVSQSGHLTDRDLNGLRRKYCVAPWSCAGGIYGTREQVRLQRSLLRKALSPYGRFTFLSQARVPFIEQLIAWSKKSSLVASLAKSLLGKSIALMESAPHLHRVLQGIPTEHFVRHAYFRHGQERPDRDVDPARDRCGITWFAPILPFTSKDVLPFLEECKRSFARYDFDFYIALLLMNPRSVICLMGIIYDKQDDEQAVRADRLYNELLSNMQAQYYQQYRVALCGWVRLFEASPELLGLNNRIKAALDPMNILAPGRYGIGAPVAEKRI